MSDSVFIRATKSVKQVLRKRARALPLIGYILISFAVIGILLFVRSMGWLQKLELIPYDRFVNQRMLPEREKKDDVIRLVGMTERDLQELGYPISDDKLLAVLKAINEQQPCVIGLDIYRDLPEPRIRTDAEGKAIDTKRYADFGEELKKLDRLYVIERVGYVFAPEALRDTEQVTANNFNKDPVDGYYRRGPLFVMKAKEDGTYEPVPALSLALALKYLDSHGIGGEFLPNPGDKKHPDLLRLGKTSFQPITSNAGGYVGLDPRDYEYLVSFQSPVCYSHRDLAGGRDPLGQGGSDTPYDYSFSDVLAGGDRFKKDALKDKVVLIATVMQSIKDSNPTPIHDNLRGVQQHAIMIRQLIDAAEKGIAPMSWWPEWGEVLWIAGCTLAGGGLGLWLRTPWKLVPALAALLAGIYFAAWYAFNHGVWILLAAPAIGSLFAAALVTSYVVALERADRRVVQSLFSKHVSKKVADAVFEQREQFLEGGKMAPRSFTGTVLFTDLVSFSTASEKLSAEQVMRWLNAYMEVMAGLVEHYEGTINKYIGDAIMAVFGAPIVHQDDVGINADAVRAICCGLHMRREVPILNAKWRATEPDMPSVAMRIGIFTGPLVDGSFGSAERLEWTVIGDTVNRANRLEAAGKEIKDQLTEEEKLCSVLIGPEVFTRVGHFFETVPVPDMVLKGISGRVTVYRVLSERVSSSQSK